MAALLKNKESKTERAYIDIAALVLDPKNSRRHAKADVSATADALHQFGQQTCYTVGVTQRK